MLYKFLGATFTQVVLRMSFSGPFCARQEGNEFYTEAQPTGISASLDFTEVFQTSLYLI
ncbi:hypothetical protein PR003_g10988 [Phytophthora rubi]|uniref:Uncharacterized protein n=1 Tax=Phytophthora rubi TaxID=129364 RepID=A0A6A4FCT3_9STRA|nr:hypothetical protein PR001_g10564 [Phytophthora rubi]KAE9339477.1 hypothetical protein PR003_g10988 [Phytophthora rubi]